MNDGKKTWSNQQEAIFQWFRDSTAVITQDEYDHCKNNLGYTLKLLKKLPGGMLLVWSNAMVAPSRAGVGKTTTMIEALKHAPEERVFMGAFNTKIAGELTEKTRSVPKRTPAGKERFLKPQTMHGAGAYYVNRNWKGARLDEDRCRKILKELVPDLPKDLVSTAEQLISKVKNIYPYAKEGSESEIETLAYKFDLVPTVAHEENGWDMSKLVDIVLAALEVSLMNDGTYDYDDMCWLPVRNNWVKGRGWYYLVIIDEAQDLNPVQMILAKQLLAAGKRMAIFGDPCQAIYIFRGADSSGIEKMKQEYKAVELKLTTTYRCPKSVVKLAAEIVPDYTAAPTAPEGIVRDAKYDDLGKIAEPGDFVISRKNAPLARACMKLLREGKKAKIEGKEIGEGLVNLVKNADARDVPHLMECMQAWLHAELARLSKVETKAAEARMDFVKDQVDTVIQLSEGLSQIKDVIERIRGLFASNEGKNDVVICTNVHKAKGLERRRVIMMMETFRGGTEEEDNIRYVAITRSQHELVQLRGCPA